MKITNELAKFLAEEGALTQFIDNHINQDGENSPHIIRGVSPGFVWRNTPEGEEYWLNLCKKYDRQFVWRNTP